MDKEAQIEELTQDIFKKGAIYPRGLAQYLYELGYRKPLDRPEFNRERKVSSLLLANLPHDVGSIGSILAIPGRVAWCDEIAKKIVQRGYLEPSDRPELREKIARKLASMDGWRYDDLIPRAVSFTSGVSKEHYLRRAFAILALYELPKDGGE